MRHPIQLPLSEAIASSLKPDGVWKPRLDDRSATTKFFLPISVA
jgi:hypothetical protein